MHVSSALRTVIQDLNFTPHWFFCEMTLIEIKEFSDDIKLIKGIYIYSIR